MNTNSKLHVLTTCLKNYNHNKVSKTYLLEVFKMFNAKVDIDNRSTVHHMEDPCALFYEIELDNQQFSVEI